MRILIASDKMRKSKVLWRALRRARYSADWVSTPQDALDYLDITCYDLLVLDLGLALGAGFEVLRTLRERRSSILILGLSSHGGALHARLDALRLGADDCLSFPFFTAEFLARVQALLRRERTYRPDLLTLEDLTLDRGARELSRGDQVVQLNRREFQLMELLMLHPGCLFSPQQLQDRVWEWDRESPSPRCGPACVSCGASCRGWAAGWSCSRSRRWATPCGSPPAGPSPPV